MKYPCENCKLCAAYDKNPSESTSRVFGISIDQLKSKTIATLLKNL